MYKNLKHKLKQLQRNRLLLSIGLLACLGLFISQLSAAWTHRPQKEGLNYIEKDLNLESLDHVEEEMNFIKEAWNREEDLNYVEEEMNYTIEVLTHRLQKEEPNRSNSRALSHFLEIMFKCENLYTSIIFLDTGLMNGFLPSSSLGTDQNYREIHLLTHARFKTGHFDKPDNAVFIRAGFISGISFFLCVVLLVKLMIQLKYSKSIHANAHWIAYLPEECVSELTVLRKRMEKQKLSLWQIRLQLTQEFLSLLWVFYIQVKLDNLRLPGGDRPIDD